MALTDDWNLEELRLRSKLLFGSAHRLPAAIAAGSTKSDRLYAALIAEQAQIPKRDAGRLINDWKAAHLLEDAPSDETNRGPGRPPECVRRIDDDFWTYMQELGARYRRKHPVR